MFLRQAQTNCERRYSRRTEERAERESERWNANRNTARVYASTKRLQTHLRELFADSQTRLFVSTHTPDCDARGPEDADAVVVPTVGSCGNTGHQCVEMRVLCVYEDEFCAVSYCTFHKF